MTDKPGKRMGQQGREELSALTDEDLNARAAAVGVLVTNEDGTPRDRNEIVNELANKERQAGRQADKGDKGDEEVPA